MCLRYRTSLAPRLFDCANVSTLCMLQEEHQSLRLSIEIPTFWSGSVLPHSPPIRRQQSPSKLEMLILCWYNVGQPSATVAQHYINTSSNGADSSDSAGELRLRVSHDISIPYPANTGHSPNGVSMLGQRRRRWHNIEISLGECPVFAVIGPSSIESTTYPYYHITLLRHYTLVYCRFDVADFGSTKPT